MLDNNVEILAPAGSITCAHAAVNAGADAIYIGGKQFGARAFADNPNMEQMLDLIDYVHLHGKKIYMTVNTLLKDIEIKQLYEYLLPYYKQGLDAVIVQDMGVFSFVRKQFPGMAIHVSTQMSIASAKSAKLLEQMGAERVVPARELNLKEIREIHEQTNLEIECFVHGALCYSFSGQCLFSSILGGRSGNRGQCAQPCRLPYQCQGKKEQYYLSLKDICTIEFIPELIKAGITSFKIEGRMKKPEYVAAVTSMYRKYTDQYQRNPDASYHVEKKDLEILMDIYNRGGFSGGYYSKHNGREMVGLEKPNHCGVPAIIVKRNKNGKINFQALTTLHPGDVLEGKSRKDTYRVSEETKQGEILSISGVSATDFPERTILNRTRNETLLTNILKKIQEHPKKEIVNGRAHFKVGEPMTLSLTKNSFQVEVSGNCPQVAQKQPMQIERLAKQLKKMGDTPFQLEPLHIELEGEIFVPIQEINALRRTAVDTLKGKILHSFYRDTPPERIKFPKQDGKQKAKNYVEMKNEISIVVETREQLLEAVKWEECERIYADCVIWESIGENESYLSALSMVHKTGKEIYLIMPYVFRDITYDLFEQHYSHIFNESLDGVMIRNMESFAFLKNHGYKKDLVADANVYQFNTQTKEFWKELGVYSFVVPYELNRHELQAMDESDSELVVYGYLPMMVSAQCLNNTRNGCDHTEKVLQLKDRYKKEFMVKNYCNYCYNIIYNSLPLVLFDLKHELSVLSVKRFQLRFTLEDTKQMREIREQIRNRNKTDSLQPFTRGHFKRGVK